MSVHLVVDAQGVIRNRIEWDGVTKYAPPAGCVLVAGDCQAGDTYDHAKKVLVPMSDPAYLAKLAADAAAEQASADRAALLAKLRDGKASPEEVQAALAEALKG